MHDFDRRTVKCEFEIRATPTGGAMVRGHGAVYDTLSQNLGGFVETITPAAFTKTLGDNPDVRALWNHDALYPLGRTRAGTLHLYSDSIGLGYEISMPDTTYARDLLVSMERGDISQSSFAFRVVPGGEEWDYTPDGFPMRILSALNLHNGDVSPVTYPAYPQADVGITARAYRSIASNLGLPLELVERAARENNLADLMRNGVPEPEPVEVREEPQEEVQSETHTPSWLHRARLLYPGQ